MDVDRGLVAVIVILMCDVFQKGLGSVVVGFGELIFFSHRIW